jgi:tetratricopeptide (TPR) repeat protein
MLLAALRHREEQGDRPALAEACYALALHCQEHGQLERAEALCRRSLVLSEALRNRAGAARAYLQLGLLRERRSDLGQARFFLAEAQRLFVEAGDAAGVASTCGQLGFLRHREGELGEAEILYRRALALAEEAEAPGLQAEQWANLGNVSLQRRQWPQAQGCYLRARDLYLAAGDERGAAHHHYRMGNWWLGQRELEQARHCFEQGLGAQRALGWTLGMAVNCEGLGQVHQLLGQELKAVELYRQAAGYFEETGHLSRLALCSDRLGELLLRGENWEEACRALTRALELYEEAGSREEAARTAVNLGDAWFHAYPERLDEAESLYLQGLEEYRNLPDLRGRGLAYIGLGNVALSRGEVSQAIAMWTAAQELFSRSGNTEQSRQVEIALRQVSARGRVGSVHRVG